MNQCSFQTIYTLESKKNDKYLLIYFVVDLLMMCEKFRIGMDKEIPQKIVNTN